MTIVNKAIEVAFDKHKGAFRKCGSKDRKIPYIVHILDVAKILMYEDVSDEIIAAGILHDTLEDTDYPPEELKADFGENVYRLVGIATEPNNTLGQTKEQAKATWKSRKEHSIELYGMKQQEELWVPLADKLSNLQSIHDDLLFKGDVLWKIFNAPKDKKDSIAWYYTSLRNAFRDSMEGTRTFTLFDNLIKEVF